MLKKAQWTGHETAASKSSVRELRSSLQSHSLFPQAQIEVLFPRKGKVVISKLRIGEDRKADYVVVDKALHFVTIDDACIPFLKTLHSYPNMYPRFEADEGALRHLLNGAHLMCPGLNNPNARMDQVPSRTVVGVYVHQHQHAIAIGITLMSTEEIIKKKQGVAVEILHAVGDSLWNHIVNIKE